MADRCCSESVLRSEPAKDEGQVVVAPMLVFSVLVFKQEASVRVHAVLPLHTVLPGPEPGFGPGGAVERFRTTATVHTSLRLYRYRQRPPAVYRYR